MFFKKFSGKLLPWITLVTLGMTIIDFAFLEPRTDSRIMDEPLLIFFSDLFFAMKTPTSLHILLNGVGMSLILYRMFMLLESDAKNVSARVDWKALVQTAVILLLLFSLLYSLDGWGTLLIMLTFAFFIMHAYTQLSENRNLFSGFARCWQLSSESFGQVIGLQCILLLTSFSFLIILSAPLLYFNTQILEWNFAKSDVWSRNIIEFLQLFAKLFAFNLILPVFGSSIAYLYFSLCEIASADSLKKAIAQVGTRTSKISRR